LQLFLRKVFSKTPIIENLPSQKQTSPIFVTPVTKKSVTNGVLSVHILTMKIELELDNMALNSLENFGCHTKTHSFTI